jgi:hypothetical protein
LIFYCESESCYQLAYRFLIKKALISDAIGGLLAI